MRGSKLPSARMRFTCNSVSAKVAAMSSTLRPSLTSPLYPTQAQSGPPCSGLVGLCSKEMVRAVGIEPTRAKAQRIFIPATAFAATRSGVCGLDYPFTMLRLGRRVGAARLVSTPSAVLSHCGLARDRHLTGFPEFEQFCIAGFPASTQSGLSPLRLPIPPRPQCQSRP